MLISFLLAYFAFTLLSLTKNRHYQQLWPGGQLSESTEYILQTLGWVGLSGSSVYLLYQKGIGIGLTEWCGVLSAAALLLVLQFSYAPRTVAAIALLEWGRSSSNSDRKQ
ncbi:MAG TPA: DUF3325 domain-containing protein [Cellvibrio sp.]|nr:DUF3325 domain-containing protein [Cellvibrio sp.]